MREHLFRGKDVDGNWVEGDLIKYSGTDMYILPQNCRFWDIAHDGFTVIPETVGEWSGLTDASKPAKKIFEGDIVASNRDIFKVIFRDGMFELTNQNEDSYVSFWQVEHIEVIGNIYDNPELLGGSK